MGEGIFSDERKGDGENIELLAPLFLHIVGRRDQEFPVFCSGRFLPIPPFGNLSYRNVYWRPGPSRASGGNRRPGKAFGGLVPLRPPVAASRDLPGDHWPAGGPAEFAPHPPGITANRRHIRGNGNGQELADQRLGRGRIGPLGPQPADDDPPGPALPPGADAGDFGHGCPAKSIWSSRIFPRWRTWFSSIALTPIRPTPPGPLPSETTLARLRRILPHCDVLIVTTTQQKYRSARVAEELAAAAPGRGWSLFRPMPTRTPMFARTGGTSWNRGTRPGHIFFVDSVAALADAQQGRAPQGEFAALVDLLTRQFAGHGGRQDSPRQLSRFGRPGIGKLPPPLGRSHAAPIESLRGGHRPAARRVVVGAGRADPRRTAFRAAALGESPAGPGRVAVGIQSLLARVAALPGHRRPGLRGAALSRADAGPACPVGRGRRRAAPGRNIAATANCRSGPARWRPAVSTRRNFAARRSCWRATRPRPVLPKVVGLRLRPSKPRRTRPA